MARPLLVVSTLALLSFAALEARADEVSPEVAPASVEVATTGGGISSPAMLGTGLVMSSAGIAGVATGAWLFTQGGDSCQGISRQAISSGDIPTEAEIDSCIAGVNQQVGGVIAMVTGGALLLGGVPVLAVGASPSDEPGAAHAVLSVSPTGAALKVTF